MADYVFESLDGAVKCSSFSKIIFEVGPNSITIDPNGIVIKAMSIEKKSTLSHKLETMSATVTGSFAIRMMSSKIDKMPAMEL